MARHLKLTDAAVRNLRPPASGRTEYWDTQRPAFGLRVSARGTRTWQAMTRHNGKARRISLGRYPDVSLAAARRKAAEITEARSKGQEPVPATVGRLRLSDVAEDYLAHGLVVSRAGPRAGQPLRRAGDIRSLVERQIVPALGDREWNALRRGDANKVMDAVREQSGPAAARKVHECLRRLGKWAVQRDRIAGHDVDRDPFAGLVVPAARVERDRLLSNDELRRLWRAANEMGYAFGDVFKIMVLTTRRLREVAEMQWDEVDLDQRLWIVPPHRSKNGYAIETPLSEPVVDILNRLPRFAGPFVFSTTVGRRPVSGFTKSKARLDRLSGIKEPWRLHDLRRLGRSMLAELGVSERVAEKALGHLPRNTLTRIYDRHGYTRELRDAFNWLGTHVMGIVEPPPAKVVKLTEARHG